VIHKDNRKNSVTGDHGFENRRKSGSFHENQRNWSGPVTKNDWFFLENRT
jgi:hypothetical protein